MKIRVGFVSNSSTSSFCIYGCYLEEDEALKFLFESGAISEKQSKEENDEIFEVLYDVAQNNKMECHSMPYCSEVWFGFDFLDIPDNVNVGEWKKEKEAELRKLFENDIKCDIYSEAWQDC